MGKNCWFFFLTGYLLLSRVILYVLYTKGMYAKPWAVGFESIWFVLCGLFFWFWFSRNVVKGRSVTSIVISAWSLVAGSYLVVSALSIAWQLLMISRTHAPDEWDGVLAGYAQLFVYKGYTATERIDAMLQFVAAPNEFLQAVSILLVISVVALMLVRRKQVKNGLH